MNRPVVVLLGVFIGACWGLAAALWGVRVLWAADPWSLGALVVAGVMLWLSRSGPARPGKRVPAATRNG